jgi:hypothetical protein
MPRGPRRRQGSISIKASGLCVSCGGMRSSPFHPAPQEWSDFYHWVQYVSSSSKKNPIRLCHSCYGSISKQFACSALERVGPNNDNNNDIATVVANNACRRSNSFPQSQFKLVWILFETQHLAVLMPDYAGARGFSRNNERQPSTCYPPMTPKLNRCHLNISKAVVPSALRARSGLED